MSVACGIFVLAAGSLQAQGRRGPDFDLDRHMERLTERLSLTEEQAAQLRPIFQGHFEAMQAMVEQRRAEAEARREEMREQREQMRQQGEAMRDAMAQMREQTHAQVAEILTEEQLEKFQQFQQQEMRARRAAAGRGERGMRGQRRGPPDGGGRQRP
jgi:Spy/CpxP family protein refolding chaperone